MSDEAIRPHKPVAAIAVIICLFNGSLLYLASLQFSGDSGMGNKEVQKIQKKLPRYFETKANKIFYNEQIISFEKFSKLTLEAQKKQTIPEILFTPRTQNGLRQDVVDFLEENDIVYREISN